MQYRNYPPNTGERRSPTNPEPRRGSMPSGSTASNGRRETPRSPHPTASDPRSRHSGAPDLRGARQNAPAPRSRSGSPTRKPDSGRPRSASDSRRPQGNRRPIHHKPPRRRPRISLFAFVVFICAAAIIAYVVHFYSIIGIGTPKYVDNVYVDGISFAGQTREQAQAAVDELEREWLDEVYTLQYQEYSWEFSRAMVNADIDYDTPLDQAWNLGQIGSAFQRKNRIQALEKNPVHLTAKITYDDNLLTGFIDQICRQIDVEPVDAVVVPDVNAPLVLQQSTTGLKVNAEQLREQLVRLITSGEGDTAVPVDTLFPAINSDDVSFQVIGQFSTDVSFRSSSSRHNVRLALSAFNGLTVLDGQRISFNDVVGPRTESAGFREATEYAGDVTTKGWGGGVCQASTTLYNALIMADATIVERHQHSMTVTYVSPSCDAAVLYGSDDLVFENNTGSPIYIYTSVTSDVATVTIYGKRPQYFYHLESVVVEENVPSTRKLYIDDTSGKHVYYKDDKPVLQSEGKPGCITQGWIVSYDWDTREEVSRVQVSSDHYKPGASVYYVGVHDRNQVGIITDY